jgi:hypothetical protein
MKSLIGSRNAGSRHLVTRNFDTRVTLFDRQMLNDLVQTSLGFSSFSGALEMAHDSFHMAVGSFPCSRHLALDSPAAGS